MRLAAFFLMASACPAASPVITDVVVESVSHSSAQISFRTNEPGGNTKIRIDYGPTPELGYQTATTAYGSGTELARGMNIGGLASNTQYYFRPMASDNDGNWSGWICPGAGEYAGYRCNAAGEPPFFTTANLPARHPAEPEPPQKPDTAMPPITGLTLTVSVDALNRCTDLAEQLAACAQADTSLNHQVIIPAGASCVGIHKLPPKKGPGTCVVRTSADALQLPPEGVRITPAFLPAMAHIVIPAGAGLGQGNGREAVHTGYEACGSPPCTEGWRFVGIHFTHEPHTSLQPTVLNITGIEGNVLTLDGEHGLQWPAQIQVADIQGVTGLNGTRAAGSLAGNKIYLYGTTPSGSWTPGTGYVVRSISVPITDASNTQPIVLTTAHPHGLMNKPALPVASAAGPVLTVSGTNSIAAIRAVEITGSSAPEYNGIWTTASVNGAQITLQNGPASACAADCGTVREKDTVQVFGVEGNTAANGSKLYTVLSPTTLRLDEASGNGDYVSGGFLTYDPDVYLTLVAFNENAARMVLDRCYLEGLGFPSRVSTAVVLYSANSAVIDSYISGINSWRGINPRSKTYEPAYRGGYGGTSTAISMSRGQGKAIINNTIVDSPGITLFADNPGAVAISDITIARNHIVRSDKYRAGSALSDGRWYGNRHFIEFKQGRRIAIEGNILDGNWADYVPLGPAILLSPRGMPGIISNNAITDLRIANNVLRNISTAIQLEGSDNQKSATTGTTARVRIHNNLVHDLDFYRMRSTPSGIGGPSPSGAFGGAFLFADWPMEDITVTHNTVYDNRGKAPAILFYDVGRAEGLTIKNNIFTHNFDYGYGGIPKAVITVVPNATGTPRQVFDQLFTWCPAADPTSTFSYNAILPGVKNSSSDANYDDSSPAMTVTTKECRDFYADFPNVTCVGAGTAGETANRRFALAGFTDPQAKNFRLIESSPFKSGGPLAASDGRDLGVDVDALEAALGKVMNVRAMDVQRTEAVIGYLAPDEAACHVEYDVDAALPSPVRIPDGGGSRARSVPLTGLPPGTPVYYRVLCASDQPTGSFVTAR